MTSLPPMPAPQPQTSDQSMTLDPRARVTSWISGIALVVSWVWVAQASWRQTFYSLHPWAVGDWVINLQGGLVRRGFIGEMLFLSGLSADSVGEIVIAIQLLSLAALYTTSFALFLGTSRSPAWMMLLLSPAFTLFPLLSFDGGLRKELLTLVSAALLGLLVRRRARPAWIIGPFLVYLVAVAGHETASLMLPAVLYLLWFGYSGGYLSKWMLWVWSTAFTLVALSGLVFSVAFSGSPSQVQAICRSWLGRGASQEACTGAVAALDDQLLDVVRQVSLQFPDYFSYVPLALLAALPLVLLRVPKSVWALLALTYIALTPVLLTGIDYGRWIYLATGITSLAAMVVCPHRELREVRVPLVAAVLYVVMWSLPYTGPVTQTPLFSRLVGGPYHLFAVWLGQITGVS